METFRTKCNLSPSNTVRNKYKNHCRFLLRNTARQKAMEGLYESAGGKSQLRILLPMKLSLKTTAK